MKRYDIPGLGIVRYVQDDTDARHVSSWLTSTEADGYLGADTETSGLDIFMPGYKVRLVQLGNKDKAYVWDPAVHKELTYAVFGTDGSFENSPRRTIHYWHQEHDLLSLDATGYVSIEESTMNSVDVERMSRLLDPRGPGDGGTRHSLKDQSNDKLGLDVKDAKEGLVDYAKRKYGFKTEAQVWAEIPIDDDQYITYAGQDALLTARLAEYYTPMIEVKELQERLAFEHRLSYDLMYSRRKGWLLDSEYAIKSAELLQAKSDAFDAQIAQFDVPATKSSGRYASSRGLAGVLSALGAPLVDRTPTNAFKLDKAVLASLAGVPLSDIDDEIEDDALASTEHDYQRLAMLVLLAKKYDRLATYCASFPEYADAHGRVHAAIKPLAAKTGRMSASDPALQQLPGDVPEPRACFLADPGHVLASIDYGAVEWRVAAIVTDDANMKRVFDEGSDMHAMVADIVYGAGNWDKHRKKRIKSVGLGRLYGGGLDTLSRQSGLDKPTVQKVLDALDSLFPGIRSKSRELQKEVNGNVTELRLRSGRLFVTDRGYAALNGHCQGWARDLLAEAIVRLCDAGFRDYIRLPLHDEIVFSFPEAQAQYLMEQARVIMESEIDGVKIVAEAEILGSRWKK